MLMRMFTMAVVGSCVLLAIAQPFSGGYPFIKVYSVTCPNQTAFNEWFCNKLIGWCNLLTKWSDLTTENLECCYEVNQSPSADLFINETIRVMVNECVKDCEGRYKYVQCNGEYADTVADKTIISDGLGSLEVLEEKY